VYLASTFVQEDVYEQFSEEKRHRLIRFISGAVGNPLLSSIRGGLFEAHAQQRLCSGETFKIRLVSEPGSGFGSDETSVHFGLLETREVTQVKDIRAGYYSRAVAKNFESIDSQIAPDRLFQMTVSDKHAIKHNGQSKQKDKLDSSGEIGLYFVEPSDRYAGFQRQNYINIDGMAGFLIFDSCHFVLVWSQGRTRRVTQLVDSTDDSLFSCFHQAHGLD
jgi:hypothetical protein